MSHIPPDNYLSEYHRVTVIVRLVLDDRGRISYGEFIDVSTGHQERFVGWRGLLRIGSTWIKRQHQDGPSGGGSPCDD